MMPLFMRSKPAVPSLPDNVIGDNVRRLRVAADLTQEQFVARCQVAGWDISRETYAKIEARLRRVTDIEIVLLSKVLRCTVEDLFRGTRAEVLRQVGRE